MMMLLFELRQPTRAPWFILSACFGKRTCWRCCKITLLTWFLVRCAFLRKLATCVGNITAFCQHLLRLIKSAVLADTDIPVNPYIGLSLIL